MRRMFSNLIQWIFVYLDVCVLKIRNFVFRGDEMNSLICLSIDKRVFIEVIGGRYLHHCIEAFF